MRFLSGSWSVIFRRFAMSAKPSLPASRNFKVQPEEICFDFLKEHNRLQQERIAAFKEYADDVKNGVFPEAGHLVAMDEGEFKKAVEAIEGNNKPSSHDPG